MIGIVTASELWSCRGSGMLRLCLLEPPPPTRGSDASRTAPDSVIVFCNTLCVVFFAVL